MITYAVIVTALAAIALAGYKWHAGRWTREYAFLVMLVATLTLAGYSFAKSKTDNALNNQYKACLRGNKKNHAMQQFALKNPDLPGTAGLLVAYGTVPCEQLYGKG